MCNNEENWMIRLQNSFLWGTVLRARVIVCITLKVNAFWLAEMWLLWKMQFSPYFQLLVEMHVLVDVVVVT